MKDKQQAVGIELTPEQIQERRQGDKEERENGMGT